MKKTFWVIVVIIIMFSFWTCKKQEEQQAATEKSMPSGPIIETPGPAGHGDLSVKTEFQVVVPPEVKDQWAAVTFVVNDKQGDTKEEHTVNIGDEFTIPGSGLTVRTGPFLPDFKMSGQIITSASNNPGNPAVGIAIFENDKKIFPPSGEWGWLYVNFPTIHSFQHERYGLVLKEGIKK